MERIDAKTRELLGASSFDSYAAEQALTDWFLLFPESLYRVVGGSGSKTGLLFVHRLLASDAACCRHLCNPDLLNEETSKELARFLIAIEPRLDIRLAQAAIEWSATAAADRRLLRRCLAILDALGSGSRITSALVQLLNCGNAAVRSKVIELLVRWSTNEANVREWLRDPDPRVRANVLESLAGIGQGTKWIRGVQLQYLHDPNGRAAANAAIGLYRSDVSDPALARLAEMALSQDPSVRCSAVWAMGHVPDLRLLDVLNQLRADPDARVRWLALRSLSSFNRAGVKPKQVADASEPPDSPAQTAPAEEPVDRSAQTPPPKEPAGPVLITRTFGRLL